MTLASHVFSFSAKRRFWSVERLNSPLGDPRGGGVARLAEYFRGWCKRFPGHGWEVGKTMEIHGFS